MKSMGKIIYRHDSTYRPDVKKSMLASVLVSLPKDEYMSAYYVPGSTNKTAHELAQTLDDQVTQVYGRVLESPTVLVTELEVGDEKLLKALERMLPSELWLAIQRRRSILPCFLCIFSHTFDHELMGLHVSF